MALMFTLMPIIIAVVIVTIITIAGILAYQFITEVNQFTKDMISIIANKLIGPIASGIIKEASRVGDMAESIAVRMIPGLGDNLINDLGDIMGDSLKTLDFTDNISSMFSTAKTEIIDELSAIFKKSITNMDLNKMVTDISLDALSGMGSMFAGLNLLGQKLILSPTFVKNIADNVATSVSFGVRDQVTSQIVAFLIDRFAHDRNNIKSIVALAVQDAINLFAQDIFKLSPAYALKMTEEYAMKFITEVEASLKYIQYLPITPAGARIWGKTFVRNVMKPQRVVKTFVRGQTKSLTNDYMEEMRSWNNQYKRVGNMVPFNRMMNMMYGNINPADRDVSNKLQLLVNRKMMTFTKSKVSGFKDDLRHYGRGAVDHLNGSDGWFLDYVITLGNRSELRHHIRDGAYNNSLFALDLVWGYAGHNPWVNEMYTTVFNNPRSIIDGGMKTLLELISWGSVASTANDWTYQVHKRFIDTAVNIDNYKRLTDHVIRTIGIGSWGQTVGMGAHMVFNNLGDTIGNLAAQLIPGFAFINGGQSQLGGDIEDAWRELYTMMLPCGMGGDCRDPQDALFIGDMLAGRDPFEETKWLAYRMGTAYGEQIASSISSSVMGFASSTWNKVTGGGGGCFIAGTQVLLSDGSEINIEQIEPGYRVLSFGNRCCKQGDEQVTQKLGDQLLYGFNEMEPFFTGGHCFQTTDGWKAICPELTKNENVTLDPGKLQVGDLVFKRNTDGSYQTVELTNISSISIPANTDTYGLLLIGDTSYHANNYVVAMNYPVITAGYMRKGLAKLSIKERARVMKYFSKIKPELNKSISDGFLERII
jgi:hypothetical protein